MNNLELIIKLKILDLVYLLNYFIMQLYQTNNYEYISLLNDIARIIDVYIFLINTYIAK